MLTRNLCITRSALIEAKSYLEWNWRCRIGIRRRICVGIDTEKENFNTGQSIMVQVWAMVRPWTYRVALTDSLRNYQHLTKTEGDLEWHSTGRNITTGWRSNERRRKRRNSDWVRRIRSDNEWWKNHERSRQKEGRLGCDWRQTGAEGWHTTN